MHLLLDAMHLKYGYDFRQYAQASLRRRLWYAAGQMGCERLADMVPLILRDPAAFARTLSAISITVSDMFRDPDFYLALRREVIPALRSWPEIKIWDVGCACGEETWSLAILLREEGLYERCHIYATDFNQDALAKARDGIFPIDRMKTYTANYRASGGENAFSDYYHARYAAAIFDQSLAANITFADHNLLTDSVFITAQLILCRNVLIYFDRDLQQRVLGLFADSLSHRGFLTLGNRESLSRGSMEAAFEVINRDQRIFRRQRRGTPP